MYKSNESKLDKLLVLIFLLIIKFMIFIT